MTHSVKYVGKESINLAQIGHLKPNQVFQATAEQFAALERNAPGEYILADEEKAAPKESVKKKE